jgi:hypothetical protein
MPVFKVPVTAFIETTTREEAQDRALDPSWDELPSGRYLFGQAGQPEELPPERAASILKFSAMLKMANSYSRDEYVTLDDFPDTVRFSPPAAAAMQRLRQHSNDEPSAE